MRAVYSQFCQGILAARYALIREPGQILGRSGRYIDHTNSGQLSYIKPISKSGQYGPDSDETGFEKPAKARFLLLILPFFFVFGNP
jgi:hypothetical protein